MQADPYPSSIPQAIIPLSLSRSLDVIGDPWTLNILRKLFQGVRRFQDFQNSLGIPKQTLMLRLQKLAENAIVYKKPVKHERIVYEYHLTPKGRDLYSFILMIWRWHRRWHLNESVLPAKLYHRSCGKSMSPVIRCAACDEAVESGDVAFECVLDVPGGIEKPARKPRIFNELEALGDDYLAAAVVGDGWSILVLNAVLRGIENYDALQKALSISTSVLTVRIKSLLSLQLLEQHENALDRRMSLYRATDKARDIFPIIITLIQWGDRWLAGFDGPPDLMRHVPCGELLSPILCCDACGERLHADSVSPVPFPASA
ncbi:winged helix-turn-helix transcriptional regulator [Pseudohalioglobus lutimaris]|uniref:HTH hxlR-type domain-containing protein n=1 Tax=Pseudohalioglobus lutimaris TaxID=1737061 RepID=A0A2N5X710_9GAMM|nr:winged helix-turn-helix transcriptional regulator [Pseudohalioglobus lutimaris]PLW70272.1 hypothetical protein C0039_03440 [Pseudohalioglobus lutimaris]